MNGVDKTPGAFDVATDKRVFHLQAASGADQLTWVDGIRAWRAYADIANSPASALNRRSITIPRAPAQAPPPVPNSSDSLDAAPAPPGAPYVLAGAYPPPKPSVGPVPDASVVSPQPSPKPSVSPAPSPVTSGVNVAAPPVSTSASIPTPTPSPSPVPGAAGSSAGSYVSAAGAAMKRSGEGIQRTSTPPAPAGIARQPSASSVSEPSAPPTPLSDLLGPPSRASVNLSAQQHTDPTPASIATILNSPAPPAADPAPAPLSDLLGPPRSAPGTPSSMRANPAATPSTAAPATSGCVSRNA